MPDTPHHPTPPVKAAPMPSGFYPAFFGLSGEARKEFEILTEEDETLEKAVSDCVGMWRGKMRELYPDPVLCRQIFLARSIVIAAKHGVRKGCGCQVAAAFALFVCDRVERRVYELDMKEQNAH